MHAGCGERELAEAIDTIRHQIEQLPEVVCALLHGSFLTGGPYRDLDVALLLDRRPADPSRYTVDLATDLTLALGRPVDVRVLNDAPVTFRYHALEGRPVLVRDPERLAEFKAKTWSEYFDFLPFARAYLREALGG